MVHLGYMHTEDTLIVASVSIAPCTFLQQMMLDDSSLQLLMIFGWLFAGRITDARGARFVVYRQLFADRETAVDLKCRSCNKSGLVAGKIDHRGGYFLRCTHAADCLGGCHIVVGLFRIGIF